MNWLKETVAIKDMTIGGDKLLYRASRDGWAASIFHSCCDNKGPTVTVIKSGNYIFGGYTEQEWKGKIKTSVSKTRFKTRGDFFGLVNVSGFINFRVSGFLTVYTTTTPGTFILVLPHTHKIAGGKKYPFERKTLTRQNSLDSKIFGFKVPILKFGFKNSEDMNEPGSFYFGFVHLCVNAKSIRY